MASLPGLRSHSGSQITPVETLPDKCFDKTLSADIQLFRHSVKFREHCAGEIHGNS